jgi:hypothetical protein
MLNKGSQITNKLIYVLQLTVILMAAFIERSTLAYYMCMEFT